MTRVALAVMALGFIGIFAAAAWIHPYAADGTPRTGATHLQLGLPPCSMMVLLGKPCPSCGMTTAFSLLVHGDILAALRANWVGVLLAIVWLALIPWGLVSAIRARFFGVKNAELAATITVGVLLTLMLLRWAFIVWL
jgi:hypothetical protein